MINLIMIEPKRIPKEFLAILNQEGTSMQSEGITDIALSPFAAKRAIDVLRSADIGITGGEIWKKKGGRFVPTYDIWNVEKSDFSSQDEYVQSSLNIAEQQVKKYLDMQGEIFITLGI